MILLRNDCDGGIPVNVAVSYFTMEWFYGEMPVKLFVYFTNEGFMVKSPLMYLVMILVKSDVTKAHA